MSIARDFVFLPEYARVSPVADRLSALTRAICEPYRDISLSVYLINTVFCNDSLELQICQQLLTIETPLCQ